MSGRLRIRGSWANCLIAGLAVLALGVGSVRAQECTVGGQVGGAIATPTVPGYFGEFDSGAGLSAALDLACNLGAVSLGFTPELNELEDIRVWHVLTGVGVRIPLGSGTEAAWIRPMLQGGLARGAHDGPILVAGSDSRHIDFPSGLRPVAGAAVRVGIPMGSGIGFVEPSIRITSFPTRDDTGPAGGYTFVTVPIRIGYAFRL